MPSRHIQALTETWSGDELADAVPQLGLFLSQSILAWRDANGAFPDEETLITALGVPPELAATVIGMAPPDAPADRPSATVPRGSIAELPEEAGELADVTHVEDADDEPEDGATPLEDARPEDDASARTTAASDEPRKTPPPLPPMEGAAHGSATPVTPATAPATPSPQLRSGRRAVAIPIGVLLLMNVGLIVGLVRIRAEGRTAVAPIAALSVDVKAIEATGAETRGQITEVRAQLDATRSTLVEQERRLRSTAETVNENAAKQRQMERDLKDLATRESRDVAALTSRMRLAERRVPESYPTVTLKEAVQLIEAAGGGARKSEAAPSPKPHVDR